MGIGEARNDCVFVYIYLLGIAEGEKNLIIISDCKDATMVNRQSSGYGLSGIQGMDICIMDDKHVRGYSDCPRMRSIRASSSSSE
jgi:hypothetical protein